MAIIIVDFDGTLYQANSIMVTLKGARRTFTLGQWTHIMGDLVGGLANRIRGKELDLRLLFLTSFFKQMKGKSKGELYSFFESLIESGHEGINYALVARLKGHLENGDHIIVSSGSLQPFLETFVNYLGIRADIIGTLLYYDQEGKCTGEIGKINHGEEKVKRIKYWIDKNGIQGDEIWAYADSQSDIPLLEFADKAVVVDPSDELKRIADARGWEIFS